MNQASIYCQNCRAANNLRETHCQKCGTRLLLVIFPNSLQYDTNQVPSFYEDHLLERVTLLEVRLAQMADSLQVAMEIIREQGKLVKEEHSMVKSLYQILGVLKSEEADKIRQSWDELERKRKTGRIEKGRSALIGERISAAHDAPNNELFLHLLEESDRLWREGDEKQAVRMLERALMLSPKNVPLLLSLAENLLRADRFAEAGKHLDQALKLEPDNRDLLLLRAALSVDEGDAEAAEKLFARLDFSSGAGLPGCFLQGILLAFAGDWAGSVRAFEGAAAQREAAEIQYLLGCALLEKGDENAALRHLQNAVLLDERYTDAWFMQAVVRHRQKNKQEAETLLETALLKVEPAAQCQDLLRKKRLDLERALPFQHFAAPQPRLLTGGALRLSRFFKAEMEKAIEYAGAENS